MSNTPRDEAAKTRGHKKSRWVLAAFLRTVSIIIIGAQEGTRTPTKLLAST